MVRALSGKLVWTFAPKTWEHNPTKMNYSFDTLMGLAQQIFDEDPLSGHLFLFVNRERDRLKILFWDQQSLQQWA